MCSVHIWGAQSTLISCYFCLLFVAACMRRSEVSLQESVLAFYHMQPQDRIQVGRFGSCPLDPLSHLVDPLAL